MKQKKNNLLIGCLCALGCETLFGFSYLFTKNATDNASAFALLGWRFLVAVLAIILCAVVGIIKLNFKGKRIKPLLLVAFLNPVIYFVGETFGIRFTTASESGAFLACIPVVSLLASTMILREKPKKIQVAGILTTLAGVLITVFAVSVSASFSVIGYLMLVVAVVSYSLYCVFVEKAKDYSGAEITFLMLLCGAVVFGTAAVVEALMGGTFTELITLPFTDGNFLIAVLYQGIGCSVLAFFLSNVAIAKIGVNRTASFVGVSTVVSIVAGVLLQKEHFSLLQMVGAVIIIAGVYLANMRLKNENIDKQNTACYNTHKTGG